MGLIAYVKDLDAPLLRLSAHDNFTLRDACQGVHVFGGIGSGKTSGSGKMLSGAYLRAGFGGVVTTGKSSEVERWISYGKQHGRDKSIIVFDENQGFNFLAYEQARQGVEGVGTVTECLMRILEAAKRASATASQRGGEPFFEDSTREVLRYTVAPVYSATGSLSLPEIIRFVNTAPTTLKDVENPDWQKRSFMYSVMDAATRHPKVPLSRQVLKDALEFWAEAYVAIPEKTRGNIVISVTTALDRFKHGRLNRVFCGRTTVVPELTFHGAVIVLAMPTLTWNEDGAIAQQIFKFFFERAVLARGSLAPEHRERPVFSWNDEAQETVHSYDAEFIGLARESKCCPVNLTQSLPAYYAKIGGDNPRDAAHSLVGKFMTHVYHSNACPETNEFASKMIGKEMTRRHNFSAGNSQSYNEGMNSGSSENAGSSSSHGYSHGGGYSVNWNSGHNSGYGNSWGDNRGRGSTDSVSFGCTESMEYVIEPGEFARILRTGGAANGNIVTGIWFQSGRIFRASGSNMILGRFAQ